MERERYLYVRENLSFSRVFVYYGLDWKSDATHQLSCPFHGEDAHPSARYYAETKSFYCFACPEDPGGDVVWFIRRKEKFDTNEQALEYIQNKFGVKMSATDLEARIRLHEQLRQSLPRKLFAKKFKDRMNDLFHKMRQREEMREYDFSLLEREVWRRFTVVETGVVVNYIQYCDSVRAWFDEAWSLIREFLRYQKQGG